MLGLTGPYVAEVLIEWGLISNLGTTGRGLLGWSLGLHCGSSWATGSVELGLQEGRLGQG